MGQKNEITRRWARRGTRPAAPQDQRTASTYISGAICPKAGKAAGLVLPHCNTAAIKAVSAALRPLVPALADQAICAGSPTRLSAAMAASSAFAPSRVGIDATYAQPFFSIR